MQRSVVARRGFLALVFTIALVAPGAAQRPAEPGFDNLKVLPKDMSREEVLTLMEHFNRALGVKCGFCHLTEREKPGAKNPFALDDKPMKDKARVMMTMTHDLNEKYLPTLENREKPRINVQCVTCHRGVTEPRMIQDVLVQAYDKGGIDSTMSRYQRLRDRYYGTASYDFGDAPLGEVGTRLEQTGHYDDGMRLLALNVEMNPNSAIAKRRHASAVISHAFETGDAGTGASSVRRMRTKYGDPVVSDDLLSEIGFQFLRDGRSDRALEVFKLNAAEHPTSGIAHDNLAEVYLKRGDRKRALEHYTRALTLDPKNENAKYWVRELGKKPKK
jgi:tetratricopeptide (TPR) repeat protein